MKIVDCDCVILCGGLGARLRNIIGEVPKVMAQVGGRPFLDLVIEYLKSQNIARVVLCTGYKADFIENYYRDHDFSLTIDFSREEEPLGTGGALKNARDIISSDPFFVFNGDSFLPVDLEAFLGFHREKNALASVLISKVGKSKDFGSLEVDNSDRVVHFREKIENAKVPLVNAGIYCFNQNIYSSMPAEAAFSLEKDFFPKLTGNEFYGYCVDEEFIDIGTPERYESVKEKFNEGN